MTSRCSSMCLMVFFMTACGGGSGPASMVAVPDAGDLNATVACVDDLGCHGTRPARCESCCECAAFETRWENTELQSILWAASDGDETLVLRSSAPFVVHLDAAGQVLDDVREIDLVWVEGADRARLYAAPDGTLIVLGMVEPIDGEGLHIERWSRAGEKLFAGTFGGSYTVSAMLEDGTVLLASAGNLDGHRFMPDNTLNPSTPVSAGATWSQSVAINASGLVTWTVHSDGESLDAYDAHGQRRGELSTPSTTLDTRSCAVALDPRGAVTLACLAEEDRALVATLQHYTPELAFDWQDAPQTPPDTRELGIGTLALEADIVTVVTSSTQLAVLSRHTAGGSYLGYRSIGAYTAVILPAAGDEVFVLYGGTVEDDSVVSFTRIERTRLPAIDHGTRQEGEPCGDSYDCASEVCCRTPSGERSCGNASGCAPGAVCATSSDCSGSACSTDRMWPGPGLCWQECGDACASGYVCTAPPGTDAEPLCVPDCLAEGNAACEDLAGYVCTNSTDESDFEVRACLAEPPPVVAPTNLPIGAECAGDGECASGHCAASLDAGAQVCVDAIGDPCEAASDSCRFTSSTGLPSMCVVTSGGSMCAEGCLLDEDCPEFYFCGEVFDGPDDTCTGYLGRVCMRTCSSGECDGGLECRSPVCVPPGGTVNVLGVHAPECS